MPPEALDRIVDAPEDAEMPSTNSTEEGRRWDAYSVGILISAIFNRTASPYPALEDKTVIVKVLLHDLRPDPPTVLSNEFLELLRNLVAKDPTQRPTLVSVFDKLGELEKPADARGRPRAFQPLEEIVTMPLLPGQAHV